MRIGTQPENLLICKEKSKVFDMGILKKEHETKILIHLILSCVQAGLKSVCMITYTSNK